MGKPWKTSDWEICDTCDHLRKDHDDKGCDKRGDCDCKKFEPTGRIAGEH